MELLTTDWLAGLRGTGELEVVEVGVLLHWLKSSSSTLLLLLLAGDVAMIDVCAANME